MLSLDLESAPEQQDLVRRSRSALLELQTLYEEVRNYAAPIQLERSKQSLPKILNEVWGHLVDQWRSLHIQLDLKCDAGLEVSCDKHRIGQVIRNLFENSLSVSPVNTQIVVTCDVVHSGNKSMVRVSVEDQGPGLNQEQKARIFEPFYTTKTKGTGLGMAICNRILEAHGGRIYVAESAGSSSGANIVFELPAGQPQLNRFWDQT